MSEAAALKGQVCARLCRVFGEPRQAGTACQWSSRMRGDAAPMRVLVDGDDQRPTVWIFDPRDPVDGIKQVSVGDQAAADELVREVLQRVAGGEGGRAAV